MTYLLMDTSGDYAVLALAEEQGGTIRAAHIFEGRRTLSRRLMGEMDGLLKGSGLTLDDISAFAVGLGPGSFTGVRVGVTTCKTLAQVTGKPLVGVRTLDAYAAVLKGNCPLVTILPSRRDEVYAAIFFDGVCTDGPFACAVGALEDKIRVLEDVTVGGATHLLPDWAGRALELRWTPPEGLARLAAQRLAAGMTDDPLALAPLYVVAPSISAPKHAIIPPVFGTQGLPA